MLLDNKTNIKALAALAASTSYSSPDSSSNVGTIPGHPSPGKHRRSAGEAVEGSHITPSPPTRQSATVPHSLPVGYLTKRPYLRDAGSDQANYMAG